ncbi:hypothetical protein [Parabacteroides distasonis]|uniref:hypothetical protein n=1 Tax=Parabacteroides distasonis TaxID=823 RepID=UPI001BDF15DC|nr:hypothetical protein [Parabacteroides distasonis]MBT1281007.1 hypothetical protein [Parabacteroides distasonis]UVR94361.1 hypothetical protein NXX79_13180 [Parabacteroides distasonis]
MKRRLLFLFAVFMVGASVGWGQMIPTYYKVAVGTGGDGSSAGSPIYKANLEAALSDAALSSLDSVIILLPEGEYSANAAPYSITKSSLAIIGEGDTSTVTIKSPVDIELTNGGNVSFQKVHLTAKTSTGRGVVDIKSSKTTVSFSESKITIEGRGTGDSGSGACFGIVSQLTVDENTVNFINSRMYMSEGFERGLAFRDGGGHTLNFIGSKMEGPSAKGLYPYVIGICSWVGGTDNTNPVTYNIRNSVVDVNYYAIFAINQAGYTNAVNITIDNSSVTAWAALFLRGDLVNEAYPHNVAISNTHLYGRSYQNGPSDGFGTVVLDNCQNLTMTMDSKSSIVSENKAPIDSPITYMCVADVRKNTSGTWTFTSTDGSKALIQSKNDKYAPTLFFDDAGTNLEVLGVENVEFKTENEKPCIVSIHKNGTLNNAASNLDVLLTNMILEEEDKVIFPEGEYTLPMTLPLDKSITIQGTGRDKTIIKGAILINGSANNTATDVKIKGLSIDYTPTKVTSGKCTPIIEVTGNADLLIDNCIMNNNTQGYGDRKNPNPAEVLQNAILLGATAKGTVHVENTTINLAANAQAGVLIDGELTDVSLVNTKIDGQVNGSNQFGVYIHHKKTPVTVDSTTILLNNHYCIYANNAGDQKLTIKNKSNIVGYGALYLYETSDMNVHVSGGSILTGKTKNKGVSDSFAAIAISTNNSTVGASNNEIVIEDSYIGNKFAEQETMAMTPIKINGSFTPIPCDNKIILKGKTIVSTTDNIKNPTIVGYGMNPDEYNNVIMVEGTDVQLQDQNGKPCVIINKPDGSFRNAAVSIVTAIDFGELYGSTYYHEGIAYAGDIILIPDTTMAETLNSLNVAKPNFFPDVNTWEPYTIPDGVIFNCKDGRLVIEENTAKAYAIANPFKRVYWLNQGAQSFSIKECVVAIDIKSDTTWATSFQDRQVNILNGATLTVSVPMALDTVMMEEDAQVVFTATEGKLTARSLRFAPLLSATGWKAFGMPFTSAVIKNSTEEEISAPSVQNVDNGIWFARLKDNKTPEFVVDESAFGMAGLWAANGDTYTISSEGAFEFKTLEEPAAPTETGTFLMCSNPNTFTITLKQSAYILTTDGTSFEQEANPEIKPFQSFVLTDAKTLSTLRSLRIGDGVVTGNQTIEPVDGYYVTTDRGAIVIHTPEPMDVVVIRMNGKVAYRGEVTDGQRIMVSSGIYAVNGQLVRVK